MVSQFRRDTRGVAAVEGALLLPIFLGVVIGAVDTSNLLLERHKVEQGLELGANYLAKARTPVTHLQQARNISVTGELSGGTSSVRGWEPEDVEISTRDIRAPGAPGTAERIAVIVILESDHAYEGFGIVSSLSRGTVRIRARHEERIDL